MSSLAEATNNESAGNSADRVLTSVGFFASGPQAAPKVPEGYELQFIDPYLHADLHTFEICLVAAPPEQAELFLEEAISLLGEDCPLIVMLDRFPADREALALALIDHGADDVIEAGSAGSLKLALHKARRTLLRQCRLLRRNEDAELHRVQMQISIDNLPSPIFFKNREGIYTGCNRAFARMLGLNAREIVGSSVWDIAPEKLAKAYEDADEELMQAGGIQIYGSDVRYADGELHHVVFHKAVTRDRLTGDVNGLAGAMVDVTERRELELKLQKAAETDPLTGAYNRRKFFELASESLQRRSQDPESGAGDVTVLVLDIDHFKRVNDTLGHAGGDAALRHLVGLLRDNLPERSFFARAGGEEFFCLLEGYSYGATRAIAEHLRGQIADTSVSVEGKKLTFTVSIGVASVAAHEEIGPAILRADQALYRAKKSGRNRVVSS